MPATRSHLSVWIILLGVLAAPASQGAAIDNQLTEQEKRDGWILLFDGKSAKDWMTSGWEACPEVLDRERLIRPSVLSWDPAAGTWFTSGHGRTSYWSLISRSALTQTAA